MFDLEEEEEEEDEKANADDARRKVEVDVWLVRCCTTPTIAKTPNAAPTIVTARVKGRFRLVPAKSASAVSNSRDDSRK